MRNAFSLKLEQMMREKGWRQADLARASGLARDNISRYIRGASDPAPDNLQILAKVFGVSIEELMPPKVDPSSEASSEQISFEPGGDSAWVRINRAVKVTTALEIQKLLRADRLQP